MLQQKDYTYLNEMRRAYMCVNSECLFLLAPAQAYNHFCAIFGGHTGFHKRQECRLYDFRWASITR